MNYLTKVKKKQKQRGPFSRLNVARLIVVLTVCGLVAICGYTISHVAARFKIFNVRHIDVTVAHYGKLSHLSPEYIKVLSGIREGESTLNIDLAHVNSLITKNPWVDTVMISKSWSDTISIHVVEKNPIAIFNGKIMGYVSDNGQFIDTVKTSDDVDYPIITSPGYEFTDVAFLMNTAIDVIRLFKKYHDYSLSEIKVDKLSHDIHVFLETDPFPINFGHGNFDARYAKFKKVYADLTKRGYRSRYVDLTVQNKVVARIKLNEYEKNI